MYNIHIAKIVQASSLRFLQPYSSIASSELSKKSWCGHQSRWCTAIWNNKEQYEKRMLAVKKRLTWNNFTINQKWSNSKPVTTVSFLGYSVSKEGIASDPNQAQICRNAVKYEKKLESFVGLANSLWINGARFYNKNVILNEIRKYDFRLGKRTIERFGKHNKWFLC